MTISEEFYIEIDRKIYGPTSMDKVQELFNQKSIDLSSYLYDLRKSTWKRLGETAQFKPYLPSEPTSDLGPGDFLVYMDTYVIGPFTKEDLLSQLDSAQINCFHYVKSFEESRWVRLLDHPKLSVHLLDPPELPEHKNKNIFREDELPTDPKVGPARRYVRISYSGPASVEKQGKSISGLVTEISEGGCFVELNSKSFHPEDEVILKIRPGLVPLKFETRARVASILDRGKKGIGLEFLDNVSGVATQIMEVQSMIQKFQNKERGNLGE